MAVRKGQAWQPQELFTLSPSLRNSLTQPPYPMGFEDSTAYAIPMTAHGKQASYEQGTLDQKPGQLCGLEVRLSELTFWDFASTQFLKLYLTFKPTINCFSEWLNHFAFPTNNA